MIIYLIITTIILILVLFVLGLIICREGYVAKIFVKLGWRKNIVKQNWAVISWNNMLEKLNYEADIVFFGDSIIRGSEFNKHFIDKKIVNLGYTGDTLSGMLQRVTMIKAVNPNQIFILGGINGLTNKNVEKSIAIYDKLLDKISEILPDKKIYVHSILPISSKRETKICDNKTIKRFNQLIAKLTKEKGIEFIDIYPFYEKDGVMNPDFTTDGLHINQKAYDIWVNVMKNYIF